MLRCGSARNRNSTDVYKRDACRAKDRATTVAEKRWTEEFDPGSDWTLAACLTHASRTRTSFGASRVADGWVTRGNLPCSGEQPGETRANTAYVLREKGGLRALAAGWAHVRLASWWGNGPPRRRSVAGLRGWPATLGLRHGPDSYGRQQWGILDNGRKPDPAMPRVWRRPAGCKALSVGKKSRGLIPLGLDVTHRRSTG